MIKLSIIFILLSFSFIGGIVVVKPPLLSLSSSVQKTFKEPENDLDEFVGSVKTINVEIEEHEFITDFIDLASRYKRKLFQISQFDREGKKVEKVNYRTDGVPLPRTTYTYDKNGVLLKENHYNAVSGQPYLETIYIYDLQGRLKEVIGKNIEENKILSRKLYTHNEKKNYTEITNYDWDNVLRGKIGFIWNNEGKVSEIIGFSPKGEILGKGRITYDEKGNIVEMVFSPSDGSPMKREKYTYEFDGHGNWVKKNLYYWVTEEGKSFYKLMNITYRIITYY